jgi:hypothetical protein
MKIKSYSELRMEFSDAFLSECCDGAIYVDEICIAYRKNGNFHNENGPARVWENGRKEYYLNGRFCSENQWKIAIEKFKKNK